MKNQVGILNLPIPVFQEIMYHLIEPVLINSNFTDRYISDDRIREVVTARKYLKNLLLVCKFFNENLNNLVNSYFTENLGTMVGRMFRDNLFDRVAKKLYENKVNKIIFGKIIENRIQNLKSIELAYLFISIFEAATIDNDYFKMLRISGDLVRNLIYMRETDSKTFEKCNLEETMVKIIKENIKFPIKKIEDPFSLSFKNVHNDFPIKNIDIYVEYNTLPQVFYYFFGHTKKIVNLINQCFQSHSELSGKIKIEYDWEIESKGIIEEKNMLIYYLYLKILNSKVMTIRFILNSKLENEITCNLFTTSFLLNDLQCIKNKSIKNKINSKAKDAITKRKIEPLFFITKKKPTKNEIKELVPRINDAIEHGWHIPRDNYLKLVDYINMLFFPNKSYFTYFKLIPKSDLKCNRCHKSLSNNLYYIQIKLNKDYFPFQNIHSDLLYYYHHYCFLQQLISDSRE